MTMTPWGRSDSQTVLAEGIISYGTPSHGGIWLSAERRAKLPAGIKNFLSDHKCVTDNSWWEEDCDWVVPYLFFQKDIRAHGTAFKFEENLAAAYESAKAYHPELFKHIPAQKEKVHA